MKNSPGKALDFRIKIAPSIAAISRALAHGDDFSIEGYQSTSVSPPKGGSEIA